LRRVESQADAKPSAPVLAVVGLWANDAPKADHFYRDAVDLNPMLLMARGCSSTRATLSGLSYRVIHTR